MKITSIIENTSRAGLNEKADIYIQREAFMPHYSLYFDKLSINSGSGQALRETGLRYIGIDKELRTSNEKNTPSLHRKGNHSAICFV